MGLSEVGRGSYTFLLDGYSEDSGSEKEEYAIGYSLFAEVYGC